MPTFGLGIKAYTATTTPGPLSEASYSQTFPVVLTSANYIAQFAAGAPINSAGPFTAFSPIRIPQIVLGVGGVATTYTITGTDFYGNAQSENVVAGGAGTYQATKAYATITAFSSNVNPGGTTDLQTRDTMVGIASRGIVIGAAGVVALQLDEDAAVSNVTLPAGVLKMAVRRINITNTTATGLALLY